MLNLEVTPSATTEAQPTNGPTGLREPLNGIQEVRGSNPLGSTILRPQRSGGLSGGLLAIAPAAAKALAKED